LLGVAEQLAQIGSWAWDLDTDELLWSDNLFRLLGFEPAEIEPTLQRLFESIHSADVGRVRSAFEAARHAGGLPPIELRILRPDGAIRHLQITAAVEERGPGHTHPRLVGFVRDITEQRSTEREVAVHQALSRALAAWDAFEPGAKLLLREIAEALGLAAGALWLPRGDVLVARVLWSEPSVDEQRLERVLGELQLPRGIGLAGRAWERRQPVAPARSGADDIYLRRLAAALGGISSAVALPAVSDEEVLAVVVLYSGESLEPGERLMRAFTSLGSQLGVFLARRRPRLEPPALTAREFDVLRLAAQGLAGHEIEARLRLSRSTVKSHFEHIYTKLGVSSRVSAVAYALREGLIE